MKKKRKRKKESEITDETLILHPIPTSGIFFFPHAKWFSDTIWVLYNSTQSCTIDHYERVSDSTAEGFSLTKLLPPAPLLVASHKAGLSPVFDQPASCLTQERPLLRFDQSSRAIHRTQENVYL